MNRTELQNILREALREDIGTGDLSSSAIFSEGDVASGTYIAKAEGTVAGLAVIAETYSLLDEEVAVTVRYKDGDPVEPGDIVAQAEGPTSALLSGERVVLNLLQHLSGIATATRQAVELLDDPDIRICDTRKTLPGLRMLQKYAVRCGGGYNHRYRLDDGVMIKDNHIRAAGSISRAVEIVRSQVGLMVRIEVETETGDQVLEAVKAGADIIMFDNRTPEEIEELIKLVPKSIITEASGGITHKNISRYKNTGVDYISLGSLTHSVNALDISFNLD